MKKVMQFPFRDRHGVRVGYRFESEAQFTLTRDYNGAAQLTAALRSLGASQHARHPADWPGRGQSPASLLAPLGE